MLLFEFCESTSPLFRKISFTKPPRITYKAGSYEFFTDFTELFTRNEDFIAKIKDSEGGHEQGEHKIDIAFRVGDVFVAIQAACQQFSTAILHQAKLNAKFRESINAFASSVHKFEPGTKVIFVFATMFDFKTTKKTQELIDKQTKFTVVKLAEFEDCIFPFFLLRNKEKLRDGAQIRDLISLYYRRITGHPAPNNKVGVFGANSSLINSAPLLKTITVRKFNAKRGGAEVVNPQSIQELLTVGGELLGISAVKVRRMKTEAEICDLNTIQHEEIVLLTTEEDEKDF
jgi:hypothetical protein